MYEPDDKEQVTQSATFRSAFFKSLALAPLAGLLAGALLFVSNPALSLISLQNVFWIPIFLPLLLPVFNMRFRKPVALLGIVAGLVLEMAVLIFLFLAFMGYALTRNEWH